MSPGKPTRVTPPAGVQHPTVDEPLEVSDYAERKASRPSVQTSSMLSSWAADVMNRTFIVRDHRLRVKHASSLRVNRGGIVEHGPADGSGPIFAP